ncbi:hypothetical protein HMPREF0972_00966 [Actinomyces sp. oral taxon 848 str. F0332]|nr:hypothetical protein HMPREF0972_00966 [Actinomyces sp. oral taxon 848 str. F0332]
MRVARTRAHGEGKRMAENETHCQECPEKARGEERGRTAWQTAARV